MRKRLAIVTTHPIQYFAPIFKMLAARCELHVFYTWGKAAKAQKFDHDFRREIEWDIPLLDGYEYSFLENRSKSPASNHFFGIQNPDIIANVKDFAPEVILVYGWANHSHLAVIHHFGGKIPLWFRGDSTLFNNAPFWKRLPKEIFLKYLYKRIDKAFYVGSASKNYFSKYGLTENKLVFAPHAVDNDRFAEVKNSASCELRSQLGITEEQTLFLFAGKFEPRKNPLLLLNTFIELNNLSSHLVFVGNGVLEENMKAIVNKLKADKQKIGAQIHFIDFQNQSKMPIYYQACDVFCLPSSSESWGLAINEAMAAGKAILASSQVGCAQDLVTPGKNGCIFNGKEELRRHLKLLAINKSITSEMGNESKQLIKAWSFTSQVDAFIKELSYV